MINPPELTFAFPVRLLSEASITTPAESQAFVTDPKKAILGRILTSRMKELLPEFNELVLEETPSLMEQICADREENRLLPVRCFTDEKGSVGIRISSAALMDFDVSDQITEEVLNMLDDLFAIPAICISVSHQLY